MRIEWLPSALDDLQQQIDYVAERDPRAALRCSERIEAVVGRLPAHPFSGRAGRHSGTREIVISRTPYVAVYRVGRDCVLILRLLHGAQAWPDPP